MKKRLLTIILAAVMSFSPIALAEEPVSADKTTDAPVYIVRSGGTVMLTYENGKLTSEKMYTAQTAQSDALTPADLKLIDGTNYVPFRYLFEKFGFEDVTKDLSDSEQKVIDSNLLEKFDNQKGCKVFAYSNDSKMIIKATIDKDKVYTFEEGKKIELDDNQIDALKTINNGDNKVSYIPLRSLEKFGFHVEFDKNTVFISDKPLTEGEKDNKQDTPLYTEAKKKYKKEYIDKRNDNYTTYSDLYLFNDNVRSLKKDLETYGYKNKDTESFTGINCVNQYGNILIFTDQHLNLYYTEITNNTDNIVKKPSLISNNCYDMIAFNGSYIFGIKLKDGSSYSGTMVKIKVGFDKSGQMVILEETEIKEETEERKIENAETLLYKELDNGEQYIYFLDKDDNYTLKRIQVNNAGEGAGNVKKLTCNGNDLMHTQYYSISGKYLFHNKYDDNSTTIYTLDSINGDKVILNKLKSLEDEIPVKSLIGTNNGSFYCVIDNNNINNVKNVCIYNINNEEKVEEPLTKAIEDKIRNLAVFNNKLYGKRNSNYDYDDKGYVNYLFTIVE